MIITARRLLIAVLLSLAVPLWQTALGDPTLETKSVKPYQYGPVSRSLAISLSSRQSTYKVGATVLIKVVIKNEGQQPLFISRIGDFNDYAFNIRSASGQTLHPLDSRRTGTDVDARTGYLIAPGGIYVKSLPLDGLFDLGVGSYVISAATDIFLVGNPPTFAHTYFTKLDSNELRIQILP